MSFRRQARPAATVGETLGPDAFCPLCDEVVAGGPHGTCPVDGSSLLMASQDELVGQVIDGRFEVLERVGAGGMGIVYRAIQRSVQREVALKVLQGALATDRVALKRFFKEARAASSLRHPNTITVFDFGRTSSGLAYIAMELLDGESLADALDRHGTLPTDRALRIAVQICDSLADAHERGVVHRDLKPENVHLEKRHGHPDFVKVLDFGIARLLSPDESRITRSGVVCGTPAYMAPEAGAAGEIDARADLYSLGVLLFELLTGRLPFEGRTALEMLMQHAQDTPPLLSSLSPRAIPPALDGLVAALLAKRPDERPGRAAVVRDALEQLRTRTGEQDAEQVSIRNAPTGDCPVELPLVTGPIPQRGAETGEAPRARSPRRRWAVAAVAVAAAAATLLAWPAGDTHRWPGVSAPSVSAAPPSGEATPTPGVVTTAPRLDRRPAEAMARADRSGPVAMAVAPEVVVKVRVDGASAVVWEGSTRLGTTPLEVRLTGAATERHLVLRRRGARSARLVVDGLSPSAVSVPMSPARSRSSGATLLPFEGGG